MINSMLLRIVQILCTYVHLSYDDEIVGPKMFILCLLQGMLAMGIVMKRMMIKTMMMIMVQSLIIDDAFKMIWMINMFIMIRNSH